MAGPGISLHAHYYPPPGPMIRPANSDSDARGYQPPFTVTDDAVINVREPAYPEEFRSGIGAGGYNPFPADGDPTVSHRAPVSEYAQAFTLRRFDQEIAHHLTGHHGVVVRVAGEPVGKQEPFGGASRAVFRPIPQRWDAGYQLIP